MSNISHEPRSIQPELIKTSDELIMIGVMTSWANLDTRAAAIFNTWGRDVTGRILFYVGQAGNASDNDDHNITEEPINIIQGLPVVVLNDVTDAVYPPRRKSFAMLRHMEHNFGRHFRWFVRADDDAYIRYDFLSKILRRLTNWADPLVVSRNWVFCRLASLLSGMVSTTSQRKGKTTSSHCVLQLCSGRP
ncbi:hypothetical protein ACOMHN_009516 [Nucella lapillus]